MGFRFCLGPSGAGKSRFLHRYLLQNAQIDLENPGGAHKNYIIIVPEQYSMLTQKELVMESPHKGILNIDVQSFGRLAHRVFQEAGVPERAVLDDIGKTLLLRRVAGSCADDLQILGGTIHRPGMISEVKSILSEFMQYGIDSTALRAMAEKAGQKRQGALAARLQDLSTLYDAFLKGERDRFVTTEERMTLLAQAIPSSAYLRGSVIVLDGFTGFTPVQYSVILALIRTANEVIISLPMREDGGPDAARTQAHLNAGREDALFYLSRKTMSDLMRLTGAGPAKERHAKEGKPGGGNAAQDPGDSRIEHERDIVIGEDIVPYRFRTSPVLAHLEKNLFRHPSDVYGEDPAAQIRMIETDTVEEEVRQICIALRRLTMEKGYEYRQISVICGDLDTYGELFEKMALRYGIPVYVDKTGGSALNPLTESIRAALQIRPQSYSYQSVFRYLRSGMSGLTGQETDLLENYCLEHGIRGRKKWEAPFDAETEPLRVRFLEEISPLTGMGKTARERTTALYHFMAGCGMEEKMQAYADEFGRCGDPVRQMQFSQLYRRVITLLEQVVDLIGEERISDREYAELLDAGFGEIRLGTLPQQVDRVLIGDMERTRVPQCRILFLTGVNDGNIPAGAAKGGILSELDREFLRGEGAELAPTPRQQMYLQRLYLYLNMTKPTDCLVLSMARISRDGTSLQPSYLVPVIRNMFPKLVTEHPQNDPPIRQITGRSDAMSWLSDALREYAEGLYDSEPDKTQTLQTVYGYLRRAAAPDQAAEMDTLTDAAFMRYDPEPIPMDTARKLYGDTLRGSVTRLETMVQCPMRQFLTYGLRLKERQEYRIEPADTGNILHQSIDRLEHKMRERALTWTTASDEETSQMLSEAFEETAAAYHDLILYSTARSRSRKERLLNTLQTAVAAIRYQLNKGDFTPAFHEFDFGDGTEAGPLVYALDGGRKAALRGRVDRVDLMSRPGAMYVKILDYKQGAKDLKIEKMKSGLQLQLMIYMQAVMEYEKRRNPDMEIIPAAMLYLQLTQPILDRKEAEKRGITGAGTPNEEEMALVREGINAAMRPTGLVSGEAEVISHLDNSIAGKSSVIPVKTRSNGEPDARSHTFTAEEFAALSEEITDKVKEIAGSILDGRAEACPVRLDNERTACTWCPFKDVCVFDPRISGFTIREDV